MVINRTTARNFVSRAGTPFLLRKILIALCTLGCLSHFVIINVDYFRYFTVATFAPYVALTQTVPLVTLCFVPYTHADNSTFMGQKLPSDFHSAEQAVPINISTVITNCLMRNFTSGRVEENTDCSVFFNATRFTRLKYYICYTLDVVRKKDFSTLETAAAMVDKYISYSFSLREEFVSYNRMVFFNHLTPLPEDEISHLIDMDTTSADRKSSVFLLEYEVLKFKRLALPYDTRCVQSYPEICSSAARDEVSICARDLCNQVLMITRITRLKRKSKGIEVKVRSETSPTYLVNYHARIEVDTFFIQACSILGLWCSLSINFLAKSIHSALKKRIRHNVPLDVRLYDRRLTLISERANINLAAIKANVQRRLSRPTESLIRRSIRLIGKIFVITLFIREVVLISIDYFQYKTHVEIDLNVNSFIEIPGISHCLDVHQWYNLSKRYELEIYDKVVTNFMKQFNYTVKEIFDSVPDSVNHVIKKCRVRASPTAPLLETDNCRDYFNVTKFFHNEFICYFIQPLLKYSIAFDGHQCEGNHPNILYSVVPDDSLAGTYHFQPIVSQDLPRTSRFLSNRLFREHRKELVIMTFVLYNLVRLPVPYDTMCVDSYEINDCYIKCLNFSRFGLAPYSELLSEPLDFRLLSYVDLKNESLAQQIKNSEAKCKNLCRENCRDTLTKTIQHSGYSSEETLELALAASKYPVYQFSNLAIYTPYEYIYQLACCASFWLGFSIFTVLTVALKRKSPPEASPQPGHWSLIAQELADAIQIKRSLTRRKKNPERNRKTGQRRIRQLFYICALTAGFSLHSFWTASKYFQYPTTVDTRLSLETNFTNFISTICITIDQLDLKGNFSLADIWSKSPKEEEILLECGHRGLYLSHLAHLPKIIQQRIMPYINSSSLCNSLFRVKKTITLAMVCYQINPRLDTSDVEFDGKFHTHSLKVHQFFTLRQNLAKYNLTVVFSQDSPLVSLFFSVNIPSTNRSKCLWSWVSYSKCYVNSLPYPYATGVFNFFQESSCRRSCVTEGTKRTLNLFSPYGETDRESSLLHETLEQSASDASMAIRRKCEARCSRHDFDSEISESYTRTVYDGPFEDGYDKAENGTSGLWFRTSDFLVPHTYLYPALRLLDLVLYIGTIYSIWFGLSALQTVHFLSSSPHTLADRERKIMARSKLPRQVLTLRLFQSPSPLSTG